MKRARYLVPVATLGVLMGSGAGCGYTADRPASPLPAVEARPDAGPPASALSPRRAMKVVSLFGGAAVENLVVDPNFEGGQFGIGRWLASFSGVFGDSAQGPPLGQKMASDSPAGVALPVGTVSDRPTDGPSRAMTLITQVPGGKGPFVVRVWVSADGLAGETAESAMTDWVRLVRVTLAGGPNAATGVDIPPDPATMRTIGGRRWIQFTGQPPGPYVVGAFFLVRLKASRHQWWLQAPEVVPTALVPGSASTFSTFSRLSTLFESAPRPLGDDELRAIDHYRRQPLRFGPPEPPPSALRPAPLLASPPRVPAH